jgi:membrane protein implicated in regulation of membrane protease activity
MVEPWFVWALIGVLCIGLEIIMPGFVIFFFGMGGLATALLCLIPAVADIAWLQIALFVVLSVVSLVFLRRRFTKIFAGTVFDARKGNPEEDGIGSVAEVIETTGPVNEGRIRFRGTTWKSRTREGELSVGSSCRILGREGLLYIVGPVDATGNGGGKQ